MLVFIPKKGTSIFNMYCYSLINNKEYIENEGTFLYTSDIAVILYKYVGFNTPHTDYRRGYIVSRHTKFSSIKGTFIPCVDDEVDIIYQAEGRKFDELKKLVYMLENTYSRKVFTYHPYYWLKMASLINHISQRKTLVTEHNVTLMHNRINFLNLREQLNENI